MDLPLTGTSFWPYLPPNLAKKGQKFQKWRFFDQFVNGQINPTVLVDPKGEKLRA